MGGRLHHGLRPVGIALYHAGRLSLLLDGHHRAVAYTRLEQEVPCITIEPLLTRMRIKGTNRQNVVEAPGLGEINVDNLGATARQVSREAVEIGSGKRMISRDVARNFVKATGVDVVLRTEAY